MRTTVTIDPDTEALLREEMARSHSSFKRVLNEAVRRGLASERLEGELAEVLPFRSDYQPGVDRLRLQQADDDLETERAAAGGTRR